MKEIESIIIFPQYLHAKLMRIAMETVTAMPVSANAPLIMSMPKIVQFLDVSSFHKCLLVGSECILYRFTSCVPWYFLSNWQEFRQIDQCASGNEVFTRSRQNKYNLAPILNQKMKKIVKWRLVDPWKGFFRHEW